MDHSGPSHIQINSPIAAPLRTMGLIAIGPVVRENVQPVAHRGENVQPVAHKGANVKLVAHRGPESSRS